MNLDEDTKQHLLQNEEQQYMYGIENDALIENIADRVMYKIEERRLKHELQLQLDAEAKAEEEERHRQQILHRASAAEEMGAKDEQRRIQCMLEQYVEEGRVRFAMNDPEIHQKDVAECTAATMTIVFGSAALLFTIGIVVLILMAPDHYFFID